MPSKKTLSLSLSLSLKRRKVTPAFTIVELLIVVVVIAILAAITIVAYNGIQQQARRSAQLTNLGQIQRQIEVDALQELGTDVQIARPAGYTEVKNQDVALLEPVQQGKFTAYAVFDTDSVLGTDWVELLRFKPLDSQHSVYLRRGNTTTMGVRVDTTARPDAPYNFIEGLRDTTGRHILYVVMEPDGFTVGADNKNRTPVKTTLDPYDSDWQFNTMILNANVKGVAALVFPESHTAQQRAAVMHWLDKKYTVDHYDD